MGRQPMVRQTARQTARQPHPAERGLAHRPTKLPNQHSHQSRLLSTLKLRLDLRRRIQQGMRWSIDLTFWGVQHHSLAIWLSSLSVLVGIAVASVGALLNPNNSVILPVASSAASADLAPTDLPVSPTPPVVELPSPPPLPEPAPPQPAAAPPPSATSALTAIAFSCAAGCFFLSQSVKPRPAPTHRILAASPAVRSGSGSSSRPGQPLPTSSGANLTPQPALQAEPGKTSQEATSAAPLSMEVGMDLVETVEVVEVVETLEALEPPLQMSEASL